MSPSAVGDPVADTGDRSGRVVGAAQLIPDDVEDPLRVDGQGRVAALGPVAGRPGRAGPCPAGVGRERGVAVQPHERAVVDDVVRRRVDQVAGVPGVDRDYRLTVHPVRRVGSHVHLKDAARRGPWPPPAALACALDTRSGIATTAATRPEPRTRAPRLTRARNELPGTIAPVGPASPVVDGLRAPPSRGDAPSCSDNAGPLRGDGKSTCGDLMSAPSKTVKLRTQRSQRGMPCRGGTRSGGRHSRENFRPSGARRVRTIAVRDGEETVRRGQPTLVWTAPPGTKQTSSPSRASCP